MPLQRLDVKNTGKNIKNEKAESLLRKINVNNLNPFRNIETDEEKELSKSCPESPIYYEDNEEIYAIGIINECFEFQYFDRNTFIFLFQMVNNGRLLIKKTNKGIDEDNIIKLELMKKSIGPSTLKYFLNLHLKNLCYLDFSSNPIKSEGALYLSKMKFENLITLNLNSTEIGDEGIKHISNLNLKNLNHFFLIENNITFRGIEFLIKSLFINNLITLSLSNNKKIGDKGIRIMTKFGGWFKLNTLNLDNTNLTDISLKYLTEASMPKLKKLNILNNDFSEEGNYYINILKFKNINVIEETVKEGVIELDGYYIVDENINTKTINENNLKKSKKKNYKKKISLDLNQKNNTIDFNKNNLDIKKDKPLDFSLKHKIKLNKYILI